MQKFHSCDENFEITIRDIGQSKSTTVQSRTPESGVQTVRAICWMILNATEIPNGTNLYDSTYLISQIRQWINEIHTKCTWYQLENKKKSVLQRHMIRHPYIIQAIFQCTNRFYSMKYGVLEEYLKPISWRYIQIRLFT